MVKHLLKFTLTALLLMCSSLIGFATNLTFVIDAPERIEFYTKSGTTKTPLTADALGKIYYSGSDRIVYFQMVSPYQLVDVRNKYNKTLTSYDDGEYLVMYDSREKAYKIYVYEENNGDIYTFTTNDPTGGMKDEFSLTIDNPAGAKAWLGTASEPEKRILELQEGENKIAFNAAEEGHLTIAPPNKYTDQIYNVTLDGEKVSRDRWYTYEMDIQNGSVVVATVNIPEEYITLTFTYSEEGEGCIGKLLVNGEELEDFDGLSTQVLKGSKIKFERNPDFYISRYSVNDGGAEKWMDALPSIQVMNDTKFWFNAHPARPYDVVIFCDHPERMKIYNSRNLTGEPIELEPEGPTTYTLPVGNPYLSWRAVKGCGIDLVTLGEDIVLNNFAEIPENSGIMFLTAEYERNYHAIVWIDAVEGIENFYFKDNEGDAVTLAPGYNEIDFYQAMSPFTFTAFPEDMTQSYETVVYVDGKKKRPDFGSFDLNLTDGSIAKIYVLEEPEECSVITKINSVDGDVTVKYDRLGSVNNFLIPLKVTKNTEMSVRVDNCTHNYDLTVNGEKVEADEDGNHNFLVNAKNTTIQVSGFDAIEEINDGPEDCAIYNLQGICVGNTSNTRHLPAGIYVINGKKTNL